MKDARLEVKQYAYYDKKTVGLDFEGLKRDMKVRLRSDVLYQLDLIPSRCGIERS
jgi:aspartate/tyrosine/aromatic aminotransferase